LNIAKANEISPANARNCFHHPASNSISPNFTAPTGQLSLFNAQLIFVLSKDIKFFPKFHSALNVSCVCALISLREIHIAVTKGNFIKFHSKSDKFSFENPE
jgi:hypothetical protein